MKILLPITFLFLLMSCKSETDKLISSFDSKVNEYQDLVLKGVENHKSEIEKLGSEISVLMDAIGNEDLSDEQQSKVTGISLRFQVAIMSAEEEMHKNLNTDIERIKKGLDSIEIEMIEPDSL